MKVFRFFDFVIASEISIPYLSETDGKPDVHIHFSKFPFNDSLAGEKGGNGLWGRANNNSFEFRANGIARYLVHKGTEILIDPFPQADKNKVRGLLTGIVIAALLHQRGFVVLHGGAVNFGNTGMLFLGESGAGKSSLVSYIQTHGAMVLSDELCILKKDINGIIMTWPVLPHFMLCEDAIQRQRIKANKIQPGDEKFRISADSFSEVPISISRIAVLQKSSAGLSWRLPGEIEKLKLILRNLYLRAFLNDMDEVKSQIIKFSIDLLNQADLRVVYRPFESLDEKDFLRKIEESFEYCS
ncbi:MAG: hypothetical protein HQM10_26875 [Candidatus Riflebacteria bacterium]|nr:hypothetical protein [Candidatus Riflebacteria bacterium]